MSAHEFQASDSKATLEQHANDLRVGYARVCVSGLRVEGDYQVCMYNATLTNVK